MMRNLKGWAALALSAAMVVSMGACGTSDKTDSQASDDSNSSSTTGYDVSGVKKDEKIAKMLPSSVTKDGKLTVGMDTSYAPAEFLAADGKTPVGFDVDIVKALAKTFGLEADPQTSNFDSIIPSIGSKYDIGVSSFTITPERMKAVDFVSMFKAGSTWVVKKGNPNKVDTSDLCGLKIAVQTGTTQEEEVNKGAEQCKADNKLDIQILSNKLQTDVTTNVVTGKADVFYADSPVAGYAISQTDDQLEAFGEDVGVTKEAVAIKKGDSDTAKAVQAAMQKLMEMIRQMYGHGITALGINEGQISEELMQYCEEKALPLFELPEKYPLIDLSQIICRRLVLEENDRNAAEQLFSSILDAEHLSRERVMAQARYLNLAPLTMTDEQMEKGLEIFEDSLKEVLEA